ncbi:hypothetical protein BJ912DRAFT_1061614 [Pholiota molesta]|nr:hypothetical protein BJ912DRAFT_1061614 [Pholiota molesta]
MREQTKVDDVGDSARPKFLRTPLSFLHVVTLSSPRSVFRFHPPLLAHVIAVLHPRKPKQRTTFVTRVVTSPLPSAQHRAHSSNLRDTPAPRRHYCNRARHIRTPEESRQRETTLGYAMGDSASTPEGVGTRATSLDSSSDGGDGCDAPAAPPERHTDTTTTSGTIAAAVRAAGILCAVVPTDHYLGAPMWAISSHPPSLRSVTRRRRSDTRRGLDHSGSIRGGVGDESSGAQRLNTPVAPPERHTDTKTTATNGWTVVSGALVFRSSAQRPASRERHIRTPKQNQQREAVVGIRLRRKALTTATNRTRGQDIGAHRASVDTQEPNLLIPSLQRHAHSTKPCNTAAPRRRHLPQRTARTMRMRTRSIVGNGGRRWDVGCATHGVAWDDNGANGEGDESAGAQLRDTTTAPNGTREQEIRTAGARQTSDRTDRGPWAPQGASSTDSEQLPGSTAAAQRPAVRDPQTRTIYGQDDKGSIRVRGTGTKGHRPPKRLIDKPQQHRPTCNNGNVGHQRDDIAVGDDVGNLPGADCQEGKRSARAQRGGIGTTDCAQSQRAPPLCRAWRLMNDGSFTNEGLTNEDDTERAGRWDECEDAASGYIYPAPRLAGPVAQGHGVGVKRIIGEDDKWLKREGPSVREE